MGIPKLAKRLSPVGRKQNDSTAEDLCCLQSKVLNGSDCSLNMRVVTRLSSQVSHPVRRAMGTDPFGAQISFDKTATAPVQMTPFPARQSHRQRSTTSHRRFSKSSPFLHREEFVTNGEFEYIGVDETQKGTAALMKAETTICPLTV